MNSRLRFWDNTVECMLFISPVFLVFRVTFLSVSQSAFKSWDFYGRPYAGK